MEPFIQEAWAKEGFTDFTDIQKQAIPYLVAGNDVIAESPTGTGKTLAYALPMLQKMTDEHKHPQALIVAPTKELVMQIHQVVQAFTKGTDITSATFIGGADTKRQVEKLKKKPQILIGSPGRVLELVKAKKIKMHEVKTIIFDEFDQLVQNDAVQLAKDIIKTTLKDRQVLFFSATISKEVQEIAESLAQEAKIVRVEKKAVSTVEHAYIICPLREKMDNLRKVVNIDGVKGLAFLNDPFRLDEIANKLKYRKVKVGVLHAQENKQEREKTLRQFREGRLDLLLATDIAARGLDIEGLTHVIHLDLPDTVDQYIHRSGRVGRMGKAGTVLSFVTEYQEKKLWQFTRKMGYRAHKKEIIAGRLVEVEEKGPQQASKPNQRRK